MWHWPLTVVGHNFGTDYFGYPYLGMLSMCILCVFIGIILTYITAKTGSVWPTVILHAVNNTAPSVLGIFIDKEKITGWRSNSVVIFLITMLPLIAIATTIFIVDLKKRKNQEIKSRFNNAGTDYGSQKS